MGTGQGSGMGGCLQQQVALLLRGEEKESWLLSSRFTLCPPLGLSQLPPAYSGPSQLLHRRRVCLSPGLGQWALGRALTGRERAQGDSNSGAK